MNPIRSSERRTQTPRIPFRNRRDAGRQLARACRLRRPSGRIGPGVAARWRAGGLRGRPGPGRPPGRLLVRKLGVPGREELALGALAAGGFRFLNEEVVRRLQIPPHVIDTVTAAERKELQRRRARYRGNRRPPQVRGQIVILIDDGMATGASIRAALAVLRQALPSGSSWPCRLPRPRSATSSATRSTRSSVPGRPSHFLRSAIGTRTLTDERRGSPRPARIARALVAVPGG